eukprot:16009096-Heterocapsa_arctica.AAC.1
MRHIQTQFLWLQESIVLKHLTLLKVLGTDNRADRLTKALTGEPFRAYCSTMGSSIRSSEGNVLQTTR